jgi:hypothetical protein
MGGWQPVLSRATGNLRYSSVEIATQEKDTSPTITVDEGRAKEQQEEAKVSVKQ